MSATQLNRLRAGKLLESGRDSRRAVTPRTLATAAKIVEEVRSHGERALRAYAEEFDGLAPGADLLLGPDQLSAARAGLSSDQRRLLERTAERIRVFAEAQAATLLDCEVRVPGGRAGHTIAPMERAGCYAPGGRFPLPSSVLMTVVTARTAGVGQVFVASPRPTQVTLAAAAVAGADGLLAAGGAQAIAALAFGAGPLPAADIVVGPGNRFVTAAKQLVAGHVAIDMLAGPSELVVLADEQAPPELVAADLLAQAEHDPDALAILVTWAGEEFVAAVDEALAHQLATLPTATTARRALSQSFAVMAQDRAQAVAACDHLAPEHLEILSADASSLAAELHHYGALFIGPLSAEVLGDYGAGPNHVLPTGGTARSQGGLSVLTFKRVRTWLHLDSPAAIAPLVNDAAALARLEGLVAHARAAERREP